MKAGWAAGDPELGKDIRPSDVGGCALERRHRRTNAPASKPRESGDNENSLPSRDRRVRL